MAKITMWIAALLLTVGGATHSSAQLLKGRERVTDVSELKEGHLYFLVSDRKKFTGNTTGLPKAMASIQDGFTVNWGDKYVYWGDIDTTAIGFKWKAERCGTGWAFFNMEKNSYLGPRNTDESDVIFSATPVQYNLTDLEDGAGRFYIIAEDEQYPLTVQGFGINRSNNSLAVQREGTDEYDDQAAKNGYPGRWRIFSAEAYDASQDDGSYDDPVTDPDPTPQPANLLDGYKRILNADELEDGATYFIICDRQKYAGNSTGKPKGMSPLLSTYTINWGDQYVYWGDFNEEEEGFQWVAEETDNGRWAFRNVSKNMYLGEGSGGDQDVIFSDTPVEYSLTDLSEGAGRFYMVSDENSHSPHVQGYLRNDRPNNSLGKQSVGDDDYPGDGETNGYPGRWQIYLAKSSFEKGYINDLSQIKEGATYWIVSDRRQWAGNSSTEPRAMSTQQDSYSVKWGEKFVYWGILNEEAEGYIWEAERVGTDQWAFKNKENDKYLGTKNPGETDMVFSDTPVGFTITDKGETFTFTNSEYTTPLNVIGYGNVNRPNNTVGAKVDDSDANCTDGDSNGYPGQWRLYQLTPGTTPTERIELTEGFYNIVGTSNSPKTAWLQGQEDEACFTTPGAELYWGELHSGDPRAVFQIEKIDADKGTYSIRNYVTMQYVGEVKDGMVTMSDTVVPLTLTAVPNVRNTMYIYSNTDQPLYAKGEGCGHVSSDDATPTDTQMQWKVQSIKATALRTNAAKIRYDLAKEVAAVNNPSYFSDYADLSTEKQDILKRVWDKANEHVGNGAFQIITEQDIDNLKAAVKGEYIEPVYNKYQQDTLTVMSYNVKRCNGGNYRQTAKVIMNEKPDVVAIQEVDSTSVRFQMAQLAQATGMYGIFCHADTPDYGIGMLCSEKPLSVKCVELLPDFERRVMLVAEFQNYVFCSLHVGIYASCRRGETGSGGRIRNEAKQWEASGKPFIVAGDFNDDGNDDEMQGARGALTKYLQENGFTFHSDLKTPTWSEGIYVIDNIISYDVIGGVETISYKVVDDKVTSDHMPIVSELLVGFEDPNGIQAANTEIRSKGCKVYNLSGTLVADSAEGITELPGGIYIYDGKKLKK